MLNVRRTRDKKIVFAKRIARRIAPKQSRDVGDCFASLAMTSKEWSLADLGSHNGQRISIISIIRGRHESGPEGAKRPTAGDEPREFTSRGEAWRVPPLIEKLRD